MSELKTFMQAVRNKDNHQIKKYCKNNPELINQQDDSGNTPLHEAVKISQKHSKNKDYTQTLNYQKIAHYLIKHGGKLNISNNQHEIVYDRKNKFN